MPVIYKRKKSDTDKVDNKQNISNNSVNFENNFDNSNKIAIIFFTLRPPIELFKFGNLLKNEIYDIYVCINDNDYNIDKFDCKNIYIIKLDNEVVEKAGYKGTNAFLTNISSRDKAFYYINRICKHQYKYTWLIEEDVFIPHVDTIRNIDKKYDYGDYMCPYYSYVYENDSDIEKYKLNNKENSWSHKIENNNFNFHDSGSYDHWWFNNSWGNKTQGAEVYKLPYIKGMTNAIRVSQKFLYELDQVAIKHGNLFFDEIFFPTMSIHESLEIVTPVELSSLTWKGFYEPGQPYIRGTLYWNKDDFRSDYLFHPVKDLSQHQKIRNKLRKKELN